MNAAYAWVQDEPKRLCAMLTERERDILVMWCKGFDGVEIRERLGRSRTVVESASVAIRDKLDVGTLMEAAVIAAKAGLV